MKQNEWDEGSYFRSKSTIPLVNRDMRDLRLCSRDLLKSSSVSRLPRSRARAARSSISWSMLDLGLVNDFLACVFSLVVEQTMEEAIDALVVRAKPVSAGLRPGKRWR
jgi:hypothetical protein